MQRIIQFLCLFTAGISWMVGGAIPIPAAPVAQTGKVPANLEAIFSGYRQKIPVLMQAEKVPGLAVAVVDDQGILWEEGFGFTDWDRKTVVTTDTLFSIQSMSKSFTATAAMFAAQDGLVDLDAPITTYLPDFHINSIFEDHPEQKITLRRLLSHTAGLTHEAPVGGNFDLPGRTFEDHIASISATWLKFPVGTRYEYSNLGVDLAGYILQVRSGMPFVEYVKTKVYDRLGMKASAFATTSIRARKDRALGHTPSPFLPPAEWLILPSGGVFSTANDMARYLQFHINRGMLEGQQMLRSDLAETMITPPNKVARQAGYALGIAFTQRNGALRLQHGGGGFGFNSNMVWYPDLKLGAVVLTNSNNNMYATLTDQILDEMIASQADLYAQRARNATAIQPAYGPASEETALSDYGLQEVIRKQAIQLDEASRKRAANYAGTYVLPIWGVASLEVPVMQTTGELYVDSARMIEVEPGVYYDPNGDRADFRGQVATLRNIRVIKADAGVMKVLVIFYAACGLVLISALFFEPTVRLIWRKRRKPAGSGNQPASPPGTSPGSALLWARRLAGGASLFSLLSIGVLFAVHNQVFLPWPAIYTDLQWWAKAVLSLPYASLILAIGAGVLVGLAWKKGSGGRFARIYYTLVAAVLLACNLVIIF